MSKRNVSIHMNDPTQHVMQPNSSGDPETSAVPSSRMVPYTLLLSGQKESQKLYKNNQNLKGKGSPKEKGCYGRRPSPRVLGEFAPSRQRPSLPHPTPQSRPSVLRVLLGLQFGDDALQLPSGLTLREVDHVVVLGRDFHEPATGHHISVSQQHATREAKSSTGGRDPTTPA